jgi:hypothetical protein
MFHTYGLPPHPAGHKDLVESFWTSHTETGMRAWTAALDSGARYLMHLPPALMSASAQAHFLPT